MKIAVIGAGISGVASASLLKEKGHDVRVFEKNDRIGGLIQCDWVEGNLFHKVGGHVFNAKDQQVLDWFWKHFDKDNEFYKTQRKAMIWLNGQYLGYPIENYLYQLSDQQLGRIVSELLQLRGKSPKDYADFESFLRGNFGPTLYELYFKPYNQKIWNVDLTTIPLDWLEGKLPMPKLVEILHANIGRKEEKDMVHSSFYYPKRAGSQFVIDRLAQGLEISLSTPIDSLKCSSSGWTINQDLPFDAVVYSGDVRKLPQLLHMKDEKRALPEGIEKLRSNGTSTVLCYTERTDLTWLYLPGRSLKAHRIIYTGNFSPANNALEKRPTCVVEFSGKQQERDMLSEIEKLPGNLKPIKTNYHPNSYVIQDRQTRELISSIKDQMEPLDLYLCGRFAEWEYYNMDKAIEAAMNLTNKLG